jgi:flagellar biosynthetic protein FliR
MTPAELIGRFGEQQMLAFALVLARISPLFVLAPLFSSKTLPGRARTFVAVALAVGITPIATHAAGGAAIPSDVVGLAILMVKEVLVGMAFSFGLSALFAALAAAGSLLDTLVGFSFGALVDPLTGTQSSILSQLYAMVGVLVFIAIGGDGWVIQGLARTYEAVPLLEAPQIGSLVQGAEVAFSGLFTAAIQICAPVLLALVITDAALGVVTKVVPQLNIFAVGFPAKVAVAMLIIGASLPFAAHFLADEVQRSVSDALQTLRVG